MKKAHFSINFQEYVYLCVRLNKDAQKGFVFNADKSKVLDTVLSNELVILNKCEGKEEEIAALLDGYTNILVNNLTPEYIKKLLNSLRSYRHRKGKKYGEAITSMTLDWSSLSIINDYIEIYEADGEKLSQSELVKIALKSLTLERVKKGKEVPKIINLKSNKSQVEVKK